MTKYVASTKANHIFRLYILISLLSGIFDVITAMSISYAHIIHPYFNLLLNTIYLFLTFISAYLIEKYIFTMVEHMQKHHLILDLLVSWFFTAVMIINVFTGWGFKFENGEYIKGPLFILNFLLPMWFLMHIIYVVITKRKLFTKKQLTLNSIACVFITIAPIIQMQFPNILLTFFGYTLIAIIVLFTLETPDFIELEYLRKNLEQEIAEQSRKNIEKQRKLEMMSLEATQAFVQAIDEKDEYTNGHSLRVSVYSVLLAQSLGWNPDKIEHLRLAALLHDIGKIGVPDMILNKPNKLTEDEYEIIKSHTKKGGKILHKLSSLKDAETVALYHHERYDGTGYPGKLSGKNIPEFVRVVTIADSFDAMTTNRVYRHKMNKEYVIQQIKDNSGKQFDPEYIKEFIKLIELGIIVV